MTKSMPSSRAIRRTAGGLAVFGGLCNIVADYLLRGGPAPTSAAEITLEALGSVPPELVFAGSLLGAAVIPLWILGLFPVYKALEPAGRWQALLPTLLLGYGIALASGYHGTYTFYATGYRALAAAPKEFEPILSAMMERFLAYHDGLMMIMVASWMLGSLGFLVVALFGSTHYPRWTAVVSPILVPLTMPLAAALPAPFGGIIRPVVGTVIWTSFFLVAAIVTWNLEAELIPRPRSADAELGGQIRPGRA